MIVTEEEAKRKVCHMRLPNVVSEVRLEYTHCIGSACMAWIPVSNARYSNAKEKPDGEGWEPANTPMIEGASWVRVVQAGRCGNVIQR